MPFLDLQDSLLLILAGVMTLAIVGVAAWAWYSRRRD